jgi:hypothetical protein
MLQAGVLTWILPGAGHFYLGYRALGAVFCVAITLPYLTGLAYGGIKSSVNPYVNHWLFLAEMGAGGLTTAAYAANTAVGELSPQQTAAIVNKTAEFKKLPVDEQERLERVLLPYMSFYPEADVAQIYLSVAGLLNLLTILDALARAQTGGLPVFEHELAARAAESGGPA